MDEDYVLRCRAYAVVAWGVTGTLIMSAWVVMLASEHWRVAFLLGGTGCAASAVAATLHIRSFMVRMTSLVRAAAGFSRTPQPEEGGLRPV